MSDQDLHAVFFKLSQIGRYEEKEGKKLFTEGTERNLQNKEVRLLEHSVI